MDFMKAKLNESNSSFTSPVHKREVHSGESLNFHFSQEAHAFLSRGGWFVFFLNEFLW